MTEKFEDVSEDDKIIKIKKLLASTKYRAKIKGIPFILEIDDLLIKGMAPKYCPISKKLLIYNSKDTAGKQSASIERLIPDLGYVDNNCIIISMEAQWFKSDHSIQKIKDMYLSFVKVFNDKNGVQI